MNTTLAYTSGAQVVHEPWSWPGHEVRELIERVWQRSGAQSAAITGCSRLWFQALAMVEHDCRFISGSTAIVSVANQVLGSTESAQRERTMTVTQLPDEGAIGVSPSASEGWITVNVPLNSDWFLSLGLSRVSPDALETCLRQGLLRYLLVGLDLIHQCFSGIQETYLRLEQDPETGEDWLVLETALQADVDEVLANYDAYTDRWISLVPWPERDKIRLVYNVM